MKTTVQAVINVEVVHDDQIGLEKAIERIERDGAHLNVSSWIEGVHFFAYAMPGAKVTTQPNGE